MYNSLGAGHLGIGGIALPELINMAARAGFAGISFDITEAQALVDEHGMANTRSLFADAGIRPATFTIPTNWRDDAAREGELELLPPYAELAAELGVTRTATWILPGDDTRNRDEMTQWYVDAIGPVAEILRDYGISFGLEFVGPKTLRDTFAFPFMHTMRDMLDLARTIGPNVGILFDTFHFWTGHNDPDEIDALKASDIVLVHTNDAPASIEPDAQKDQERTLPMATGMIPAPDMLRRLASIGYDGPVETEPFNQDLRDIAARNPQEAIDAAADAQRELFAAAGIA